MIGFTIIFGASLAGYAGTGIWIVLIAAFGLMALSYAERQGLLHRALSAGSTALAERTLLGSLFNALCATGAAYAFGIFMRSV